MTWEPGYEKVATTSIDSVGICCAAAVATERATKNAWRGVSFSMHERIASRPSQSQAGMHAELCGAIPALVGLEDAARLAIADQHVATLSLPAAIRYVRGILRNEIDKTM